MKVIPLTVTEPSAGAATAHVDFDDFALHYREALHPSLRLSGESDGYFDQYKVDCLKRWVITADRSCDVLDFGCGIGKLTSLMARALPQCAVWGFDPSPKCLEQARKQAASVMNLHWVSQPPEGRRYDVITAVNVFHHVAPSEHPRILARLRRFLKPAGVLVIFEHNPLNPLTRYAVQRCPFDVDATLVWSRSLLRAAYQSGWQVVRKRYIVFFPKFLKVLRRFEPTLWRVPLGAQYMMVLS